MIGKNNPPSPHTIGLPYSIYVEKLVPLDSRVIPLHYVLPEPFWLA